MKAETMMKRVNRPKKEIKRYQGDIKYYTKNYLQNDKPYMQEIGKQKIDELEKAIARQEARIAEIIKEAMRLASEEEREQMVKAKAEEMASEGFALQGLTVGGLRYKVEHNMYGWTERTDRCYSMAIEGKGTVFASGTLETVARYILNN